MSSQKLLHVTRRGHRVAPGFSNWRTVYVTVGTVTHESPSPSNSTPPSLNMHRSPSPPGAQETQLPRVPALASGTVPKREDVSHQARQAVLCSQTAVLGTLPATSLCLFVALFSPHMPPTSPRTQRTLIPLQGSPILHITGVCTPS